MEILRNSTLVFILVFVLLSQRTLSMRYELKSGQMKCIGEDIHKHSISVGKYFIVNPNEDDHPLPSSHKIKVKVMQPHGTVTVHEADTVESGQFLFTAAETGDYYTCISAVEHKPEIMLAVDFEWRSGVHSVHSKDWSKVVKKPHVKMMEYSVKDLIETVHSIHEEMFFLREREEEMQVLNRSTKAKMGWLSFVSLAVCLSVAGLQFWHLKTFFEKKKLI